MDATTVQEPRDLVERVAPPIDALLLAGWILGLDPGSGREYRDVVVRDSLEAVQTHAAEIEAAVDGRQIKWCPGPAPFVGLTALGGLGVWIVDYRPEAAVMKERRRARIKGRNYYAKRRIFLTRCVKTR